MIFVEKKNIVVIHMYMFSGITNKECEKKIYIYAVYIHIFFVWINNILFPAVT